METAQLATRQVTDESLVAQFQSGRKEAFDHLVRKYQNTVYNLCIGYVGAGQDAEDALQDIFVKAYRALPRFKPEAKFFTWLYRIAVNHCLNVQRGRKVRRFLPLFKPGSDRQEELDEISERIQAPSPEAQFAAKEDAQIIRRALDKLPDSQRTAIILSYYQGLSYAEIAETMETSVSAVESLLFRGRRSLAKKVRHLRDAE